MNKYAVFVENVWFEDIHADDEEEALTLARAQHGEKVRVECVTLDDMGQLR